MVQKKQPPAVAPATMKTDEMPITETCLRQIEVTVGTLAPEHGIVLGGDRGDGVIRHVYFDRTGERTGVTYSPDYDALNTLLRDWWNPAGIALIGLAHSHPGTFARLSSGDMVYAEAILKANPKLTRLALPVITVQGGCRIHPFYVERSEAGIVSRPAKLKVLREELVPGPGLNRPAATESRSWISRLIPRLRRRDWWEGESFARVQGAYDVARLAQSRLVVVGVGGAMAWIEEMARCGVGQFVLIDPDTVALPNIATQQVYRDEIGRPKVGVLAERLVRINPKVQVQVRYAALDDLSDTQMAGLAGLRDKRRPVVSVLSAMTDSFFAQARMNRLALHLGLPSIAGQLYEAGMGAEVAWTYPGFSRTCHRCVLRSRFEAYLDEGFENDVTSTGTPIFSTTRLTAIKGFIALALYHHGSAHLRWGDMLSRIGQRPLIQARLHPDIGLPAFERAFGTGERIFNDEALWIPRSANPACPDCDGRGADLSLVGRDGDTRLLRAGRGACA